MLGKYLIEKPDDIEARRVQRDTVISSPSNPRRLHPEAGTALVVLPGATTSKPASEVEVESGAITPGVGRPQREIRFPDEGHASH